MNFVVLYSNTFAPRPEFCLFSARLAFLLYYYILYLQAVLFWGWKTSPLIAAERDSDFWRMILSSSALTMCSEEQAKSTDNYRHIKLFAWACASVRDCVGLAECGVPVNKFIWEIYLQKTDFTCILGYSLLYFSASLLFSFTFPPRIPILPLNLKTCASHYLLMAFCDLCFCSCLSFSSSSLPRDPLSL